MPITSGASSGHITKLKQSIIFKCLWVQVKLLIRRHDAHPNVTLDNDTEQNELHATTLRLNDTQRRLKVCCAECYIFIVVPSVVMQSVNMLNVVAPLLGNVRRQGEIKTKNADLCI